MEPIAAAGAGRTAGSFAGPRLARAWTWLGSGWERPGAGARDWLERELAERAGFQWLAVAFAAGCLVYFALPREPLLAALLIPTTFCAALATFCYQTGRMWRVAAVAALCLAGASAGKLRVISLQGPAIERAVSVDLSGRVVDRDNRTDRRPRIVLDRLSAAELPPGETPERVRLSLAPNQQLPPLGSRIALKARLAPVAEPTVPGGYDPRRAAFFDGIGGSGFALGGWTLLRAPEGGGFGLAIARVRAAIVERIMAAAPGEGGAVAAALLVGERSALSAETNESLRISGLAHILSISGLHMMLIAGTAFFLVRAALALSPTLALSYPIRKWAAVAALVTVTVYLGLSGGGAATVRAYVMAVVMFAAILVNRPAISMRNLALAAFVVLAAAPESIVEPGFQMSFAAVVALIAGWEVWQQRTRRRLTDGDLPPALAFARFVGRALAAAALTTLVAGLATAPFAAYHFERVATYSLLGNVLAAPLISAVIMPFGLLTLVAMPFGLEAAPLAAMVWGIDLLLWISAWVASLPGADLSAPPLPPLSLLLMAFGLLWLCLWRQAWRLLGIAAIAAGLILAPLLHDPPDILIASEGDAVAVRDSDGLLRVTGARAGSYVAEQFSDEEPGPAPETAELRKGVRCDALGCLLSAADGSTVAHVRDPAAFAEDCRRADIVVTALASPADCAAELIVDAPRLQRSGAHAVRFVERGSGAGFKITTERSTLPRPWQAVRN